MSSGAPVEDGTPIRYPSQALLCVDSANTQVYQKPIYVGGVLQNPSTAGVRIDDKTPAEIQVNKQSPLMFGYMTRVSLTEVNLDWSTPNVNEYNRYLTIAIWYTPDEPVSDPTIVGYARISISQAFYTLPEICKDLDTSFNDTIPNLNVFGIAGVTLDWVVEWNDSLLNDYSISINLLPTLPNPEAKVYFQVVPSDIPRTAVTTEAPAVLTAVPAIDYDLTRMLGIIPTRPTAGAVPYGLYVVSRGTTMQYTPYVDIVSNILTKNQNVQDNDSSVRSVRNRLCRLYLAEEGCVARVVTATYQTPGDQTTTLLSSFDNAIGTRPFKINKEFKTPKVIQWNTTENVDIIDLSVLDYLGNPIYINPTFVSAEGGPGQVIGNTADFQFTVQVSEV